MDYVKTNNSKKDCLLGRDVIKKAEDIIITEDGMRVKDLVKGYLALEAEYLKTKEENLKLQSDNLQLFSKINNTLETLVGKYAELKNEVTTLLSNQGNE